MTQVLTFLTNHFLVLQVILGLVSICYIVVKIVVELLHHRHRIQARKNQARIADALEQLVMLNNTYLPWSYEQLSEQDRAMINTVIPTHQQLKERTFDEIPG